MISVSQAEKLIFQNHLQLQTEEIPLYQSMGRLIKEDLYADRDFPPFDRVTMDGIAINFKGWEQGLKEFESKGVQAAGEPPLELDATNECIEIMTGAVLPTTANTVIPYEHLEKLSGQKHFRVKVAPVAGQNVHQKGTDRRAGEVIVSAGTVMGPPEIGVAATVGQSRLKVKALPTVAIVSTGDELVSIDEIPLAHQIRSSNAFTMARALSRWQIEGELFHLTDDLSGTTKKLAELITNYHILILSGGVSKGKFDHVPAALKELQVAKSFHRIQQRPGKPFWFGAHPEGCKVFAFPGNPVSSFMCFNRYFKPWINRELGRPAMARSAVLQADILFRADLTYFAQVRLEHQNQQLLAWPVEGHGSGDLANLVDADGFMELPRGKDHFKAGEIYPVFPYRDL